MKPVISLSKTWKPRQYSSGSPGSRKPPARLRTFENESKSTANLVSASTFLLVFVSCRLTVSANALLEVTDLSEGGVLAACAQEVAQRLDLNTAVTALVEESESLLVVCCVGLIHCLSLDLYAMVRFVWAVLQGERWWRRVGWPVLWCVVQERELSTDSKQGGWRVLVGRILTFGSPCRVWARSKQINSPLQLCLSAGILSRGWTDSVCDRIEFCDRRIYVKMSASLRTPAKGKEGLMCLSNLRSAQGL